MTDRNTYHRIIETYRLHLRDVDPKACDRIDDAMHAAGHEWITSDYVVNVHDELTATEFVKHFGLKRHDLYNWEKREWISRVVGSKPARFRVGEVLLQDSLRERKRIAM